MKSVFHLCEAFMYLASPNQPATASEENYICELLNPWSDSGLHDSWDQFDSVKETVFNTVTSWEHGCRRWFCLWLPLRRPEQLEKKYPIIEEYPEITEILSPNLPRRLVQLLPFLASLQSITCWRTAGNGFLEKEFHIKVGEDSHRRIFPKLSPGEQHPISINARIDCDGSRQTNGRQQIDCFVAGRETLVDDPELARLHDNEKLWPSRATIDRTTGRPHIVHEKGKPHVGAAFLTVPANDPKRSSLTVDRAVFLPLAISKGTATTRTDFDVHLLLHGYFLLDAGRKDIYAKSEWNRLLEENGMFPLVLPVLSDFVHQRQLSVEQIRSVTDGLLKIPFLLSNRSHICRDHNWAFCIGENGGQWRLLPRHENLYTLPGPPSAHQELAFEVFPNLARINGSCRVTYGDWPRFFNDKIAYWSHSSEKWALLLDVPSKEVFSDAVKLDYLIDLLSREKRDVEKELWLEASGLLVELGAKALREMTVDEIESNRESLKGFVKCLPKESWVKLPEYEQQHGGGLENKELLDQLWALELTRLLIPETLAPEGLPHSNLTVEDARKIFRVLERVAKEDPGIVCSLTAKNILKITDGTLADKRKVCGQYRVFRAYRLRNKHEVSVSWQDLELLLQQEQLYASGSRFLEPLQNAVIGLDLFRIIETSQDQQIAKVLFPPDGAPACNSEACVKMLSNASDLAEPSQRRALFERLIELRNYPHQPALRKALRYLLHNERGRYHDVDTLLLTKGLDENRSVWGKLAERALTERKTGWQWVPDELVERLSPEHCSQLKVRAVSPQAVEQILNEMEDLTWISAETFTAGERKEVLRGIESDELWIRLPIHETANGEFVAIERGRTYLSSRTKVPLAFSDLILVIQRPTDPVLLSLYQNRIPEWGPLELLSLAMQLEEPDHYHLEILDAIDDLTSAAHEVPQPLIVELKGKAWIPTGQSPCKPSDVIHLPGLEDELARLFSEPVIRGAYYDTGLLPETVRSHPSFEFLQQRLFTTGREALEVLGMILADMPGSDYHVGDIGRFIDGTESLQLLLYAFRASDHQIVPWYPILFRVFDLWPDSTMSFLAPLLRAVPPKTLGVWLKLVAKAHADAAPSEKEACFEVHIWYLTALVSERGFVPEQLRELKLLNRRGRWKAVESLCLDAHGIDDTHLLNRRHADILASRYGHQDFPAESFVPEDEHHGDGGRADSIYGVGRTLKQFFSSWNGKVPPEAIGGFLALLGDEVTVRAAAHDALFPRWAVEAFRDRIHWVPLRPAEGAAGAVVGSGEDIHEAMKHQRFKLRTMTSSAETHVRVANLIGEIFPARIQRRADHLFVGNFQTDLSVSDYRCYAVQLRQVEPQSLTTSELAELLLESSRLLLNRVYLQKPTNLDAIWQELSQGEQLDLDVAQKLILENAFFYFRQLHEAELRSITSLGKKWDELRYREVEEQRCIVSGGRSRTEEIGREKKAVRKRLQELLETDSGIQIQTLQAVRRKIEQYQYTPSSIPFELFQNADDAATELGEMLGFEELNDRTKSFVILHDAQRIAFMHWGRSINRFRGGTWSSEKGIERGYNRDLEKMLVLSSSDKTDGTVAVTGKFGLGFKSVFLASDAPRVLSGRLGFQVTGGLFPQELETSERARLAGLLKEYGPDDLTEGTIIELPFSNAVGGQMTPIMDPFRRLIHVVLIFSHQIKRCTLQSASGQAEIVNWISTPLTQCPKVSFGHVRSLNSNDGAPFRALMLDCERGGKVLFGLGPRGLSPLPRDIPTFWVTAPTTENLDAGFAVNAPFAIDVGRSRLAGNSQSNLELSRAVGRKVGTLLESLFDASMDWDSFRKELTLTQDATRDDFWNSLWQIMVSSSTSVANVQSPAMALLRTIIWERDCGLSRLVKSRKVMPTGLPGRYDCLTQLDSVRYVATGVLDQQQLFERICSWKSFAKRVSPGEIVSSERVAGRIGLLLKHEVSWEKLDLATAVQWEIPEDRCIPPELAATLGEVINPDLMTKLDLPPDKYSEKQALRSCLAGLRFRSSKGVWVESKDLLNALDYGENAEELLRAAFAPSDRVLHSDYSAAALPFFLVCRERLSALPEVLADWGCCAGDAIRRVAFLKYLLEGELRNKVASHAIKSKAGTWLEHIQSSPLLENFPANQRLIILGLLAFDTLEAEPQESQGPKPPAKPPREILRAIYAWWSKERHMRLQQYEQRIYPAGRFPISTPNPPTSTEERSGWLRLFLLGILHTQGRKIPQADRTFLELCERRGWISQIADPTHARGAWLLSLLNHIDEQEHEIRYLEWMKYLLGLFVIGSWIEEYASAFLAVNRVPKHFSLDQITRPRTSEFFRGGGPDAPPISRILGMGGCFVMRELVRKGIIKCSFADRHCYVPTKRLRTLISAIGGPDVTNWDTRPWERSRHIFEFICENLGEEKAIFLGDFDIPLDILASDRDLRDSLLEIELPDIDDTEEE